MQNLVFGRIELRPDERRLLIDGVPATLGARAFDLLLALVERRGRVVGKDELLAAAWRGLVVEDNNLTVQVSNLRKLLGPAMIATVTGHGYRFTAEPDPIPAARPGLASQPELPPLYGRDADVRRVAEACTVSRLVTLCGAGGIGKTSLAAVVARRSADNFAQGSGVVELAAVRDAAMLVPALAQGLGITLPGHAPAQEELLRMLQPRGLLLVLDNCEHLLEALAPLVQALLGAAPGLHILATSQEPLRVPGEHVHRLAPLAVPPPGDFGQAEDFGAVRLFVERVRALQHDFTLSAREVADVVDICRQLDGIALAIEFAAARVPLIGVAGVRSRLGERLRLLTGGSRTAARRHQTLRAALEWSYQLLNPEGQTLLRRLGVFTGGFSLEGAQLVAGDADGVEIDAIEQLGLLVDRSLISVEPGERPRYRMLESMRVFALERLDAAGETDAWQRRHAHAMRSICLTATRQRDSAWLWAEMNNARAALDWALAAAGEGEVAVAIATHTAVVLATAGPVPEAMNNLLRVQHLLNEQTPPPLAARYWQWLGRFGIEGRLPSSRCIDALERAASMFEALGDLRHVHACRRMIAEACMRMGDLAAAQSQLAAASAVETVDGPPADRMRRLRVAGLLADASGQFEQSLGLAQRALQIAEAHGIQRYCLMLMADMAWVRLRMGEPAAAAGHLQALLRRIEPSPREGLTRAYALAGLTAALVADGQLDEARDGAARTVAALRASGTFLARGDIFAWLVAASGHAQVAAQLLGATDEFHSRGETRRDRISQHARNEAAKLVAAALPPGEVDFWATQGRQCDEGVLAHLLERAFAAHATGAPGAG
jgi:predicted ATPase/DNA-binding winged helix-turn-helix (wHTH) protein